MFEQIHQYWMTKYFVCRTSKIPFVDNPDKFRTKYNCSVFRNPADANQKLKTLLTQTELSTELPFITMTWGPMFYRQIQIQQNYARKKIDLVRK